ncbi:hypothetical protein [Sphingobacterium arenae]|uniref:Plasmid transfer protein n=1 Tax=Sphingobacterium arenae TaxID=1280598 RepID=A0ABR7XYA6_9SPHI|nr:hypothetical protein [Sphingobacterium arenae]MBD1424040.1 hypothetical protein [Sphingobacterium arenae]
MKTQLITTVFICLSTLAFGQSYVTIIYDAKHLAIVNENGAVRLVSEQAHNNMLGNIRGRIDDINVNLSSVVLVQQMIHRALTEVDEALKSGRSALHIARLVQDIGSHSAKMLETAKGEPWLLLFAEDVALQLKNRGMQLAADVSGFVLQEGKNVLMDYEKRDQLMRKIILELKVIRALVFSMERSMYWAKINGALKTANPYRNFINMDKRKADEIIRYYYLIED